MAAEDEVRKVHDQFLEALKRVCKGDPSLMYAIWSHGASVTSGHPMGLWSAGWEQVKATWDELAQFNVGEGAEMGMDCKRVIILGDVAYTIGVFYSVVNVQGKQIRSEMRITIIYRREEDGWKVIHNHPDKTPEVEQMIEG